MRRGHEFVPLAPSAVEEKAVLLAAWIRSQRSTPA